MSNEPYVLIAQGANGASVAFANGGLVIEGRGMAFVTMTPYLAQVFLGLGGPNRTLNKRRVDALVRQLREGRWRATGESIIVSRTHLVNGQHRLTAIAES